ncbi:MULTISPECIES: lytic murein transglycosylase [unclassified Moraxella]|uniref:lytic murein transglycosylase n=1 Tax=unclassified Moraxella TaxID=2685852 RepID=UPI003AF9CC1D
MRLLPISLAITSLAIVSQAHSAPTPPNLSNAQFQQCLSNLKSTSTFSGVASTLEQYRPSEPDPSVIVSLNYQPEFQKEVWDYLSGLVDEERVQDGINAKNQHQATLNRIEQRYGVKGTDVLGVWGVESNFGKQLGKKDLIQSLATLSCFDRRQSYFRTEYANALKILKNGDIRRDDMKGSWAGAFGQTQFMPSTFLRLAQDFDGDGRKDLVNSQADALASTANFLAKAGYRSGEPWGFEVKLPSGFWADSNRKAKKPMSYWRNQGLTLANGQPLPSSLDSAGLILPAGSKGPAFLVGKNFDAFYSYNASENYALAIAHLSDMISKNQVTNVGFVTPWPTDDAGITRRQTREIQQALINRGYDIGEADGMIGEKSRQAIQDFQRQQGVNPDGRAGMKLYRLLMANPVGGVRQSSTVNPTNPNPTIYRQPTSQSTFKAVTDSSGRATYYRTDSGQGVIVSP